MSRSVRFGAMASLLVAVAGPLDAAAADSPATHTVTIENMTYTPRVLTVRRGDTIVWINRDLFPHTVTGPGFDSRPIAPSQAWRHVVPSAGRFDYACTLHPAMTATVVVR